MKIRLLLFILMLLSCTVHLKGQGPAYGWTYAVGGTQIDEVNGVATDDAGNVYATGRFKTTVDFDPGPGVVSYTVPSGYFGCYLAKLDSIGNFLWVKVLNATSGWGMRVAVDDSNNVIWLGEFTGTADFDFGPGTYNMTAANPSDLFVLKLDPSGNFRWARQLVGNSDEQGMGLAVDHNGTIAISGQFVGTVDFDPGPGTQLITAGASGDGFVWKINRNGTATYTGILGGSIYGDECYAVDFDNQGNLYGIMLSGAGTDIDMGLGTVFLPSHTSAYGVAFKYSPGMNLVWYKTFLGTQPNVWIKGMDVDNRGNVGICGDYLGTLDLDPGPATYNVTTAINTHREFFLKLDSAGNFRWGFDQQGSGLYTESEDLAFDADGNFYRMGLFLGTRDFDPSPAVYNMVNNGGASPYIAKHDSAGNFQWAATVGGAFGPNYSHSILVDDQDNIIWGGLMQYPADMDPGPDTLNFNVSYQGDINLSKWMACPTARDTITANGCNSVLVNGQNYTQAGTYSQQLFSSRGCDSILTIHVHLYSTDTLLQVTACGSYVYQGQTYTSSGTYQHILTNANSCDSVVTLDLQVLPVTGSSLQASFCDSFSLNGQTYFAPGSYTQVLTNSQGCDSVITLNLQVDTLTVSVQQQGNQLTAFPAGLTYQWLDCSNDMQPVSGATGQAFTTSGGSYAVVASQGLCRDTSSCITLVGMPMATQLHIAPYPNPNAGRFALDLSTFQGDTWELTIYNPLGQAIHHSYLPAGTPHIVDLGPTPSGCYSATLRQGTQTLTTRLLIQ